MSWAGHPRRSIVTVQAIACHHCQRFVHPTLHGRTGVRVDYYRTVTGPGRMESREDPRTGGSLRVLRVESLVQLHTCCECWAKPAVQAELALARRGGVPGQP